MKKLYWLPFVLLAAISLSCGGKEEKKPANEPAKALPGAHLDIPLFKPSLYELRDPHPPSEKTGWRWKLTTQSDLKEVMAFYDEALPQGHKKALLQSDKGQQVLGARYTYEQDHFQVEIVTRENRILISETPLPGASPVPETEDRQ